MADAVESEQVIAQTRAWLESAVIGLNLCPFAKAVHAKGRIRWAVSAVADAAALCVLDSSIEDIETTLLIHPCALLDFFDYNDFLGEAERLVTRLQCDGVVQLASFHPQYVFAGSDFDAVTNATNRSPFPMLHLLREESVDRALAAYPDAAKIVQRNLTTLETLGREGWLRLAHGWLRRDGY